MCFTVSGIRKSGAWRGREKKAHFYDFTDETKFGTRGGGGWEVPTNLLMKTLF
jgi:hypothetical protein